MGMPSNSAACKHDLAVGILLAGGGSRRMGRDKASLVLAGRPLAAWPAAALGQVCRYRVQVGGEPIPGLDLEVLADRRTDAGPAAGLETALLAFPGAAVVVCAVDVPLVPSALLQAALEALPGAPAVVPHHGGRWHALAAAYSPAILPALTDWLDAGRRDLQGLLTRVGARRLAGDELRRFGDPDTMLHNVNTPSDFEALRSLPPESLEGGRKR